MHGSQLPLPLVFMGTCGVGRRVANEHATLPYGALIHHPGIKVCMPSTPYDAKGLMKAAIRDNNPVCFMESETLYSVKGDVPDGDVIVEIGKAQVVRPGADCTVVAYSRATHLAIEAATALEKEGISVEILDLRSLRPLDEDAIVDSVRKTHRCVVVHEGWPYGGVGAEIADRVQRLAFDWLEAPILRVAQLDVPIPYNAKLEQHCMPRSERVVAAVKRVVTRGKA
jgi:pyruvate dehydrogenase E1 component beta subunit